jgi:hypothetical protein
MGFIYHLFHGDEQMNAGKGKKWRYAKRSPWILEKVNVFFQHSENCS